MAKAQLLQFLVGALSGSSGGQQVINNLAQRQQDKENVASQNKHNLELQKYNYDRNLELWNKQNEYNKPAMQMERFKAAGLNPNLIYGQTNTASPISTSSVQPSSQQISSLKIPENTMDQLGQFQNYALRQSQISNLDSVTKYNEQKMAHDVIKQSGTLTQNQKKELEKQMYEDLMPTNKAMAQQKLALTRAQTDLAVKTYHKKHHEIQNTELKNEMQKIVNEMEAYRRTKLYTSGLERNDPYYIKLGYELMMKMREAGIWQPGSAMQE